jgi:hypothetical protein
MSIEAMKQALEALRKARRKILTTEECHAATTSLRQAIEQAEKQEPIGYFTINDYDKWEQIDGTSGKPLYEAPQPCQTCEALARTVMMDQTGRDA